MLQAHPSLDFAPGVRMEFLEGGELLYHIAVGEREQIVRLIYRLDGDTLHTDNPSSPHSTSVRATRGAGDTLVLDFGGAKAMLVREITTESETPTSYIQ